MIKQYSKYKDINFVWLKTAPSSWDVCRLKDIVKTASGTTPKSSNLNYYNDGIHNWVRTTDLNNDLLKETEYKVTDLAVEECNLKFFPVETLLLAMYGGAGTIGKNALLNKESTINQSVCALLPNPKKYSSKFLFYFLKYFRKDWMIFALGTRKDPNINQDAVKNLTLCLPPIKEQIKIAIYLEKKTKAIYRKIDLLEQKIEHYQMLRKSLINETVTKGLDKDVKLKDSGIKWVGEIPEHWGIERLKDNFKCYTGNSISDKGDFEQKENTLDYVSTKNVDLETGELSYDNGVYIPLKNNKFKIAKKGSTLFCLEGANAGKKIGFTTKDICFVNKLCAIKWKNSNCVDRYFFYFFTSKYFTRQFLNLLGGMIGGVSINKVKSFSIAIPSRKEQQEIADYLDTKTQTIDTIIDNITDQITILKELHKTLINDVVTGKIKVTA